MAIVVLLCGAAGADAAESQKWCLEGTADTAVLISSKRTITFMDGRDCGGPNSEGLYCWVSIDGKETAEEGEGTFIWRDQEIFPCP